MADKSSDFILRMLERLDEKMDDMMGKLADHRAQFDTHTQVDVAHDEIIQRDVAAVKDALVAHSRHLEEYNQQLKEHMRRTELLEMRVEPLEKDLLTREAKLSFVAAHWKKVTLYISVVGGIAAAAWSVIQILSAIK